MSASRAVAAARPSSPTPLVKVVWASPVRGWVLLFLATQCLINVDGFINPYSRWAAMVAMVEDGTVRIDNYHQHTMDWARTPDGHYHSNKAPGPALLALPLFWAMDKVVTAGAHTRPQRDTRRVAARIDVLHVLSVVTQAIPYAILTVLVVGVLAELAVPAGALQLTAVALLFGNTASLFMNTFFGHGMAAVFVLATLLALYRRWPIRLGLSVGMAVLSDYGAALLIVPLFFVLAKGGWLSRGLGTKLLLGLAFPALIFVGYHTYSFGGPLALPNKFQNPAFVDVASEAATLWGVWRLLPSPEALLLLLFGPERGVAFTQGWVLLCATAVVLAWRRQGADLDEKQRAFLAALGPYAVVGFALLLTMNACFLNWHGGETPGPRYLSAIFPAMALTIPFVYPGLPTFMRALFVIALALSVALFVLVFGTANVLPQGGPVFPYYLRGLRDDASGVALKRTLCIAVAVVGVAAGAWVTGRRRTAESSGQRKGPNP